MDLDNSNSPSDVCCILCKRSDETKTTGPLSSKEGVSAHQSCLLYASAIYCKHSPTFDDLFGFDVDDVKNEYKRGKKLTCHHCKGKGATVGCEIKTCPRSFHYPCAREANSKAVKNTAEGSYKLYCEKHARKFAGKIGSSVKRNGLHSRREGTPSGSEYASSTGSQCKKRRKEHVIDSDSVDIQNIDPVHAPIEFELEDVLLPELLEHSKSVSRDERNREEPMATTSECCGMNKRKRRVSPCQSGNSDETDTVSAHPQTPPLSKPMYTSMLNKCFMLVSFCFGFVSLSPSFTQSAESVSILAQEYRHENVQLTVLTDSVQSIEENSSCDVPSPGPAASGCDPTPPLHVSTPLPPPTTLVSRRLSYDSPPPVGTGATDPSASPSHSVDDQQNLATPPPPAEPADGGRAEGVPVSNTTLFWRRCNELGCTETIFGELTELLICLAERVQTQQATQQDYDMAFSMLEASGKLPEIFRQQEQELEQQVQELENKRQVLRDARAMLVAHNLC